MHKVRSGISTNLGGKGCHSPNYSGEENRTIFPVLIRILAAFENLLLSRVRTFGCWNRIGVPIKTISKHGYINKGKQGTDYQAANGNIGQW